MTNKHIVPPGVKVLYMVPPTQVHVAARVEPADPLAPVRAELGDSLADLLADHGYETLDDIHIAFALEEEAELLKIKGVGPKTIEALRALASHEADEDE